MEPAYFVKFSSMLAFSVQQAAPLRFNRLLSESNKKHNKCVIARPN